MHTNPTDDARPQAERRAVSRRTVVAGAAWAVPVITFSAAAPAMAISPWGLELTGIGWTTVTRCELITTVRFCPTQNSNPAPAGFTLRVTLPPGLEFVSGGRVHDIATNGSQCYTVPPFRVTGAAGDYSNTVTGEILGAIPAAVATVGGQVTVTPGTVIELRGNFAHDEGANAETAVRTSTVTASVGASAGNDTGNSLTAAIEGGLVKFWYGTANWPANVEPTVHELGTVTGATMVDTYVINSSSGRTGGVASNGSQVWQWNASTSGDSATVKPVTLPAGAGTVLEVAAFPMRCWVRTTNGIYSWETVTSSASTSAITGLATEFSGATTAWSPYYDTRNNSGSRSSDTTGVAIIHGNGQLRIRSYNGTTGTTTNVNQGNTSNGGNNNNGSPVTGVTAVAAGSAGLMALVGQTMYTFAHYGIPNSSGDRIYPTRWTQRETGVSSIDAWGIDGYFGGLFLQSGVVKQVFGKGTYTTSTPRNLTGKTITQIYSSDGAYLALTSDGEVWYWFGNNNHSAPGNSNPYHPSAFQLKNTGTVIDLGVWANHPGRYYAGAYAIQASDCPDL